MFEFEFIYPSHLCLMLRANVNAIGICEKCCFGLDIFANSFFELFAKHKRDLLHIIEEI